MPTIGLSTTIPAEPEDCFDLSLSVDAHTASMHESGERAVAGVTHGVMGFGDTVTWRARHFGIPFVMTSRIAEYERPRRFVDEQVSGPFRRWWHEHRFEPVPGGTLMTDVVEYVSPAGSVGRLVDRAVLERYMTRLLEQRNRWLAEELSMAPGG
ncbi:SRPBCC family protein [Cellulomonas sp. HZM]|uniref:SRPBCC family protein n=1 Tax=Cellulomonas sp. HZM TaxID=1454010 RepID=UPI00049339B4|nr:SRPBCC family protein [Cellulomonas sp. HZM]